MSESQQKEGRFLSMRRLGVTSALLEILFIMIGVLIAFQADRWWEGRDVQARERTQLEALRVDIQENLDRLEITIELQNGVIESQRRLLRIIHREEEKPDDDELGYLITESRRFHRLEPVTSAYDALVASGDLRLVRNTEIRANLARFFGELQRGYEDEQLSTLYRVDYTNALVEASEYTAAISEENRKLYGIPESRFPLNSKALLSDPTISSYLALLLRTEYSVNYNHNQMLYDNAKDILLMLDEELDDYDG